MIALDLNVLNLVSCCPGSWCHLRPSSIFRHVIRLYPHSCSIALSLLSSLVVESWEFVKACIVQ